MNESTYQHLAKHIVKVEENVASASLHALPVGGRMAYYTVAHDSVELVQAVKAATDIALPYLVIGHSGSTIIHDDGFPGLVIHNQSKNIAFSVEQSQMVVETGVSLQSAIVQAAGRGLGGLIHLYGAGGSMGGALYYNASVQNQPLSDSLRSLTILMPPTRIKPEPTIVRYKGSWLLSKAEPGLTRLQTLFLRSHGENLPIILTAQLQLTSLRLDELSRRLQTATNTFNDSLPGKDFFGPLFSDLPTQSATEIMATAEAWRLKHPGFVLSKSHPNYVSVKNRFLRDHQGSVPVAELLTYVSQVQSWVYERTALELQPAFLVH